MDKAFQVTLGRTRETGVNDPTALSCRENSSAMKVSAGRSRSREERVGRRPSDDTTDGGKKKSGDLASIKEF